MTGEISRHQSYFGTDGTGVEQAWVMTWDVWDMGRMRRMRRMGMGAMRRMGLGCVDGMASRAVWDACLGCVAGM